MNDESLIDGGITNENPFLIVKLFDENGINTSSVGNIQLRTIDEASTPAAAATPSYELIS